MNTFHLLQYSPSFLLSTLSLKQPPRKTCLLFCLLAIAPLSVGCDPAPVVDSAVPTADGGAADVALIDVGYADKAPPDRVPLDAAGDDLLGVDAVSADTMLIDAAGDDGAVTDALQLSDVVLADTVAVDGAAVDGAVVTADAAVFDRSAFDVTGLDTVALDTALFDAVAPDAVAPDAAAFDATVFDAAQPRDAWIADTLASDSGDETPPQVTWTDPEDGEGDVVPGTAITVAWSEPVLPQTISGNSQSSTCSGSIQLSNDNFSSCVRLAAAPVVLPGNDSAQVFPEAPLQVGERYRIKVLASVADTSGNSMAQDYVSSTGFLVTDTTAPWVVETTPGSGDIDVPVTTTLTVVFSEPIEASSLTTNSSNTNCAGSLQLSRDGFSSCVVLAGPPQAEAGNVRFTVEPASLLEFGAEYKIRITDAVEDIHGVALQNVYTTEPGFIVATAATGCGVYRQPQSHVFDELAAMATSSTPTLVEPALVVEQAVVTYKTGNQVHIQALTDRGPGIFVYSDVLAPQMEPGQLVRLAATAVNTYYDQEQITSGSLTVVGSGQRVIPVPFDDCNLALEHRAIYGSINNAQVIDVHALTSRDVLTLQYSGGFTAKAIVPSNACPIGHTISISGPIRRYNDEVEIEMYDLPNINCHNSGSPFLLSSDPGNGDGDVPVITPLTLQFSQAMDPSSVTANIGNSSCSGSVQLSSNGFSSCRAMAAQPLAEDGNRRFTLQPASPLELFTTYQVRVTTGASNSAGQAMDQTFTMPQGFTTELSTLLADPEVYPVDGTNGVAVCRSLVFVFDEPMESQTISSNLVNGACTGTLQVSSDGFASCLGMSGQPHASDGDQQFSMTPREVMAQSTDYQVRVTTQATSISGHQMTQPLVSGFTTSSDNSSCSSGAGAYYDTVNTSLTNGALVDELHELIDDHSVVGYGGLWAAFRVTDGGVAGCDGVFDMYTGACWPSWDTCGSPDAEGQCYNREHSWPKSWWGDGGYAEYSDLFALLPVDGYINSHRSNLPLGEVVSVSYETANGTKKGYCDYPGFSGSCFEPADAFKGDLARIYFYMAVRYHDEFTCCNMSGVNGATIKGWMEDQLRAWHAMDPVSTKEIDRNNAIYQNYQGNRNPFVDHPEWVSRIDDF